MTSFISPVRSGPLFNATLDSYPALMSGVTANEGFTSENSSSHFFGYIHQGEFSLSTENLGSTLKTGQFFSTPGKINLKGSGEAVIFERLGYRGLTYIGGALEERGRLCYIDNCTVTQVFPPPRSGDPTLQALFFPPGIRQTMHSHPTLRFGFVVRGEGQCLLKDGSFDLKPGMAFHLASMLPHCFHSGAEGMVVIAFHPDSEDGPTDQTHPMLSRTYISRS